MDNIDASFKLQDRTALIAGPCNNVVQSIASKFTQLGCNVAMIDTSTITIAGETAAVAPARQSGLDRAKRFADQLMDAREINERFGRAIALPLEGTSPAQIADTITRAAEAFGGVDIYIDAMLSHRAVKFRSPESIAYLAHDIDFSLRVPMLITHSLMRFLEARKRGRVIFLVNDIARAGIAEYGLMAASRSGLLAFAQSLARETLEHNVTVNCVAMGVTEDLLLSQLPGSAASAAASSPSAAAATHAGSGHSSSTGAAKYGASLQDAQAELLKVTPRAVLIDGEKIANVVAFLASPVSSSITGQTLAASLGLSDLT
jgi:3-oxoacyl-[acyl-carrier protein] reductase